MKRIREKYVTNPFFDPNHVKKVSTACEGLCKWVRAIEVYDRVIKIISPKKAKLAEAEQELARQMDKLNEKRAQLQQVKWTRKAFKINRYIQNISIMSFNYFWGGCKFQRKDREKESKKEERQNERK